MNYTVVIVTYNRFALLKECISCIEHQNVKFDHIVIVDNKCTDGTSDYLRTLTEKYHIIFEDKNGGGAKGFCDGVQYVHNNLKTDWILLIDDDAMLEENYLSTMIDGINKHNECMAFSGSVKTEGSIDITHRKLLHSGIQFEIQPVPLTEYMKDEFFYDLSSFCGLFFASKLIDKIGYPKAEYFIWYDDSEYSLRIRKETSIINLNKTFINHKTKIAIGSPILNWRGYYGIRNSGDMIKRYGTKMQYILFVCHIRIAQFKNWFISSFCKDNSYSYNAQLYKDALDDLSHNVFGFNEKYHG
ncbi:glycosyltransferase [Bacteroides sp. AN502(2024)]|uniref:glycosyltransferase n=1 Tax=Bacteroides sp. AN502(2024) TaxID=3160599 RepID=UPI0035180567